MTSMEAAKARRVHRNTILAAIRTGRLVALKLGRDYSIELKDLRRARIYRKAGRPKR